MRGGDGRRWRGKATGRPTAKANKPADEMGEGWQRHRLTEKQKLKKRKHIDRLTESQAEKQTDRLTDRKI